MSDATCRVEVRESGRWPAYHKCGRPTVGTVPEFGKETPACSMHIKVHERRQAKQDAEKVQREKSERNRSEAREAGLLLKAAGIPSTVYYSATPPFEYTGAVVIHARDIRKLLGKETP